MQFQTHTPSTDLESHQFLLVDGKASGQWPQWAQDGDRLIESYKSMVLTRVFDTKCIALQRTGKMGTYPSCLGQEAIGVGLAQAMRKEDVFIPYYRDQAAQLVRGVTMVDILRYWGGDERGSDYANCREDLPNCVPIATQCGHAAGIASAFKIRKQPRVAVCTLGDGATSKGDFLEALNLAGLWKLPLVFIINNNQWAISTPRHLQSGLADLADKGQAAAVPGEKIDGNDLIAVYDSVSRAVERARAGKGPSLIEAVSYRLSDHTTADDASRYRSAEEVNRAWQQEPIKRLQQYLNRADLWHEDDEVALQQQCQQMVEAAVETYLKTPPQPPEAMFDYLYAELPKPYQAQYEQVKQKAQGGQYE
ncbi:pyruvate dehydrogenase (acetyl-transferring) E1 component subunit alpha [Maricurvus nonylphenolicus]|uniref:pyruvate dehydrogenase (acetyl-transferring) E1 component subunit alpha n=1 Tax=Maricurvus nonylphenolicus TaxID=1008307 RepID=UPI0036F3D835